MRHLSGLSALLLTALILTSPDAVAQEVLPGDSSIDEGLGIDATEQGINEILTLAQDFLPPYVVIGTIPNQELFAIPFVCDPYTFRLENLVLYTEMNSVTVEASSDSLDLVVDLNLSVNEPEGGWSASGDDDDDSAGDDDDSAADEIPEGPAVAFIEGEDWGCLGYNCAVYVEPSNLLLRVPISSGLSTDELGEPFIDVNFGQLEHNVAEAMDGKIQLTNCAIGNINSWLATNLGLDMFDLILDAVEEEIESQFDTQIQSFEATIEDALRGLWLQDSLDLMGTALNYELEPTGIDHTAHGLRIKMGGNFSSAELAECVAGHPVEGSLFTSSVMPEMTATVPTTDAPYHFAAMPSDDLMNQALFAVWQSGVMCFVIDDAGGALPMNTDLLGLLLGVENAELLEEIFFVGPVAMVLRTVPEAPPVTRFDGDSDINIDIEGLAIEFYPLLQDRPARLAAVAIDINAGMDLSIAADGALLVDLNLDTENLNARVTYNEIAPQLNGILETNFPGFVGTAINTVGGSLLEGIAIALPTFAGLGAVELNLAAVGADPDLLDFLGVYSLLGESTGGTSSGCEGCAAEASGCDTADCTSGCGIDPAQGGCDVETALTEAGCSGQSSIAPSDTGCQGCDLLQRGQQLSHWRARIDAQGIQLRAVPHRPRIRVGAFQVMAIMLPIMWQLRRRRSAREFPPT